MGYGVVTNAFGRTTNRKGLMSSSSKRQTTMAKMQREQRLRERRVVKQEKKQAAAAARAGETAEGTAPDPDAADGTGGEPHP